MSHRDARTGPRGGVTTIAPSGWQKATVYLKREQVRALKQTGLDRDRTMSEVLRHAIDSFFGLEAEDPRLSEHQREAVEKVLRERLKLKGSQLAEVLRVLDCLRGPREPSGGESEDDRG
jgi:hypothetical protein